MTITVVVIYGLCWLPLHTITLLGEAQPSIYTFKFIQPIWITCHWLAMSNSCYNPIVYCWMNRRFRSGFKLAFRRCPCISLDDPVPKWRYSCVKNVHVAAHAPHLVEAQGHSKHSTSSSSSLECRKHVHCRRFTQDMQHNCNKCRLFS